MARPLTLEWSVAALDDLDRFVVFLHDRYPHLAKTIAVDILRKTQMIANHPRLGRPLAGSDRYREISLMVANARYIFRYVYDGERLVMLRVFHSREQRRT